MKKAVLFAFMISVSYTQTSATILHVPDKFPNIYEAIAASSDGDTVLVQPGRYEENIYFPGHNIVLASMFMMTGDISYVTSTVLDGGGINSVLIIDSGEDSTAAIIGFTIENGHADYGGGIHCANSSPRIARNIIRQNNIDEFAFVGSGGGIHCDNSNSRIDGNIICMNYAYSMNYSRGAGVYLEDFDGVLSNNVIYDNEGFAVISAKGGGIHVVTSQGLFVNNTICRNRVISWCSPFPDDPIPEPSYGGGIYCNTYPDPTIVNCIVWGNNADYGENIHPSYLDSVRFSLVEGGYDGEGNIDEYPWFRRLSWRNFRLMSRDCGYSYNSPCIDAGDPAITDSLLHCSWGLGDERSDMGAYGGGDSAFVGIPQEGYSIPGDFFAVQNYPNPFNAATTVRYSLPEKGEVSISIHNLLGQRVATVLEGMQEAGEHTAVWDAADLPSGVYFARLETGEHSENVKMVLLK